MKIADEVKLGSGTLKMALYDKDGNRGEYFEPFPGARVLSVTMRPADQREIDGDVLPKGCMTLDVEAW